MQKTNITVRLKCFCYEYLFGILSILATEQFDLQSRYPYENVMHYTTDRSMYPIHGFNGVGISMNPPRVINYDFG